MTTFQMMKNRSASLPSNKSIKDDAISRLERLEFLLNEKKETSKNDKLADTIEDSLSDKKLEEYQNARIISVERVEKTKAKAIEFQKAERESANIHEA